MMKKVVFLVAVTISTFVVFAQVPTPTIVRVDSNLSIDEVFQLALDNANNSLNKNFDTLIETAPPNPKMENSYARAYSQKDDENKHIAKGNSPESLTINVFKIENKQYYNWTISQTVTEYFLFTDFGRKLQIKRQNLNFEPALVSNQQNDFNTDELTQKALDNIKEITGLDFSDSVRGYSTLNDVIIKNYYIVNGKELVVILFNKKYSGQSYFWFTKQCLNGNMKFEHMDGQILEGTAKCQ